MTIQKPISALRRQAEKRNESIEGGASWRLLDFVLYLMLTMLTVFALRSVLIDPVRVNGTSMLDTLNNGEVMLVDRTSYLLGTPSRGDIVVCYYPEEYYTSQQISYASRVKRVIAVGGDTIEMDDGTVYVNGEKIEEPYLTPDRVSSQYLERTTVPEGCVYVLGDNRSVSRDSRYESVGPIPVYRVVGKVRLVIYPFSRFRKI